MIREHLQVFAKASSDVFASLGVQAVHQAPLAPPDSFFSRYDLAIIVGLARDLRGSVVYSMDTETALALAGQMMGGMSLPGLDEMVKSAVCELGNMCAGSSVCNLPGLTADITPPTLITGSKLAIMAGSDNVLMTEIATSFGTVEVRLGLEE
ncbi:hypothetical protein GJ688_10605 [Heliobacillus mobilis]|uniref:Chemotaxis phosphatase CheX-like domain-containing protein n=1 Tax=Heliobacterium mobile TaxID=28064 RepID=A0A6I3SLU1_HELMO|nr:chemotaxis protein CheX [Heliobacterium mobile]MTV49427.1 hypothetical protein [Heliobacterium mobile]